MGQGSHDLALSASARFSIERLVSIRAAAQLLHRPRRLSPARVAERVCGLQAQDLGAARLGFRARSQGLTAQAVDRARNEGAIVRTWAMRGTLHLLSAEDVSLLHAVVIPPVLPAAERSLARLGVADVAPKAMRVIERALERDGPLTRAELADRLRRHGIDAGGQIAFHLVRRASLDGVACMGPDRGSDTTFALMRDWIPTASPVDPDDALREVVRRYLIGYGPAEPADFAAWAGLRLSTSRRAFGTLRGDLVESRVGDGALWSLRRRRRGVELDPAVIRLLPMYDAYLLGYRNRDVAVPRAHAARVHPGGGIIRPTVVRAGTVVGTWKPDRRGRTLAIRVQPFGRLSSPAMGAVEEEVADIGRFLGVEAAMIAP